MSIEVPAVIAQEHQITQNQQIPRVLTSTNFGITEDIRFAHLSPIELLREGIRTKRTEIIPVGNIIYEGAIIDTNHVKSLADSMSGDRGQISPITVRAREIRPGLIAHDVIDGFHRSAALSALGKDEAIAVVMYGCPDEEFFDLRVLAANSVRSVQFARVAKWMQSSFAQTEWAKKGLSLSQVFSLVISDTTGQKLHLSPEESARAKAWVIEKSEKWHKSVPTIWSEMRAIEVADPELVSQVRIKGGGHKGKGVLSPARFMAVVTKLPHEYELQQRVIQIVLDANLIKTEAEALAKAVARVKNQPLELKNIFEDPNSAINAVLVLENKDSTALSREYPPTNHYEINSGFMVPGRTNGLLPNEIEISNLPPEDQVCWWRTFPYLSEKERYVLTKVFDGGESFEEIADRKKTLSHRIIDLFKTGVRRYVIYRRNLEHRQECRNTVVKI